MFAIGTHFHPADAAGERRQVRARAALLKLDDVVRVNLQFTDQIFYSPDGFRTLPVLRQDSHRITGAARGARKPLLSEMFDALADVARAEGRRYFAYLNADIEVTAAALAIAAAGGADGYAFSRMDVDAATGAELGVEIYGLDLFVVETTWWSRERHRFRPYIAGEACWDNVYGSILCAHGRAEIVNERPEIFHERHAAIWHDGPFAQHNGYLATLDAPYFSRWAHYIAALEAALPSGEAVDRSEIARQAMGDAHLPVPERLRHAARQVRARLRRARQHAGASHRRSPPGSGSREP